MNEENSNEEFSFQIEGKDYIISEKNELAKKDQGKKIHAPSLAIGAVIAGICITAIIFGVENTSEDLLPFLITVPLQKLAYYSALKKGYDIDKPRNLAKSVTVE